MYYKTVNAKRPSGKKLKLVINKIERNGETAYFAEAIYKEMNFYISVNKKGNVELTV